MLKLFEQELLELIAKLNGVLWRKAEMSRDFSTVYSSALEKINEIENPQGLEGLTLLGDVGG